MTWFIEMLGRLWQTWRGSFTAEQTMVRSVSYNSTLEGDAIELRVERFVTRLRYERAWVRDLEQSTYRVWCSNSSGLPLRINSKVLQPKVYPELAVPMLAGGDFSFVLAAQRFLELHVD